jgi:hypothetical protein
MQVALTAVLASPHFLFRAEDGSVANGSEGASGQAGDDNRVRHSPSLPHSAALNVRSLSDYELASRLSYFLWSSMPDAELFALAAAGKLREESVLESQVRRLLADAKSESLVENFFAQWLNLRLLDGITPDPQTFPAFDAPLKVAMRRETELFAAEILRQDHSILDFLTGRYTFVNERLARHYGIAGIRGDEFQKVALTGNRRSGVLTHSSILTLTSNPGRTSPVKRGKWLLENILGSPPPDPPPDAPTLDAVQKAKPNATLREQLTIHREDPVCASCHKVMDPLGFGLENFDAIGSWREKDAGQPIDASGELPGGAKFDGPVALAKVLDKRRAEFARCLSEKLLTFALGRELVVPDRCAVEKIVDEVKSHDYHFSALVIAIAKSDPFCKTRGE